MLHLTTTCPDTDTARRIAHAALEARLAACANILPGVISLFHWHGNIDEDAEVMLVFKTEMRRCDALIALIREMHPFDLPVITWEDVSTTPDATDWLLAETR